MITVLRDFIPVSGNTHDLQNRRSDLTVWFLRVTGSVNPRIKQGQTCQGFYVVAADGTAYGFNNNRSVDRVLAFMADGLKKFRENPPEIGGIEPLAHNKVAPPNGATVLRVYSRIQPAPEGCNDSNKNLQRDHFWVLADEVKSLERAVVPEALRMRLLRFALVDAVRGEPDFWRPEHISMNAFDASKVGETVKISASFSMTSPRQTLQGTFQAEVTVAEGKLTAFKGYADCTASGSGTWTPGAPEGSFPLKFAFLLAPQSEDTVAPQAAMYGREYLAGR